MANRVGLHAVVAFARITGRHIERSSWFWDPPPHFSWMVPLLLQSGMVDEYRCVDGTLHSSQKYTSWHASADRSLIDAVRVRYPSLRCTPLDALRAGAYRYLSSELQPYSGMTNTEPWAALLSLEALTQPRHRSVVGCVLASCGWHVNTPVNLVNIDDAILQLTAMPAAVHVRATLYHRPRRQRCPVGST